MRSLSILRRRSAHDRGESPGGPAPGPRLSQPQQPLQGYDPPGHQQQLIKGPVVSPEAGADDSANAGTEPGEDPKQQPQEPEQQKGSGRPRRNSTRERIQALINRTIIWRPTSSAGKSPKSPPVTPHQRGSQGGPQRLSAAIGSPYPSPRDSPRLPLSPHSARSPTINANKPLPSPPPPGSDLAAEPPPKRVLKLNRIMATLSGEDLEKLFSGAPQYFARSQGLFTGAPHPSVAFPWDESLEIRDLTDHVQIEDEAFSCVTSWPHITRRHRHGRKASTASHEKGRAHFYPKCPERPNMLSMQGLEKGTIGFQAALEIPVSDALQEPQFGFDSLGVKANAIVEARQRLSSAKEGLRRLDETAILDHLIKNGDRYRESHLRDKRVTNAMYNELFLQILHPPVKVLDHRDPYSLSVQISALLKILAAPNIWIDFSHVEWRIRLGQILWGATVGDEIEDGASIKDAESSTQRGEERYWLLLQILLACELLVRLDAVTEGEELQSDQIRPADIQRFEKEANTSVRWAMHLARAWLQNIEISKVQLPKEGTPENPNHRAPGWLATLTRRVTWSTPGSRAGLPHSLHHSISQKGHEHDAVYAFKGKHCHRQVDGLAYFARQLRWPGIETDEAQITKNAVAATEDSSVPTPIIPTPLTIDTQRSSYFEGSRISTEIKSVPSRRRIIAAALHPSGWLSKSYVSGLMLQGEGIYHFLMATLLENDTKAMEKLGPMANLCGGFIYNGKSFWSTSCVVGRVLAAGKGSAECMGWISTDIMPRGFGEKWVNIKVHDVPEDIRHTGRKARIWAKTAVEKESSVLGDGDAYSVLPADFVIPLQHVYKDKPPPDIRVELKSLNLSGPAVSVHATSGEETPTPLSNASQLSDIHTYPAAISFSVTDINTQGEQTETFSVATDIHFVTAHPCLASQYVKVVKSPTSPTIQQFDLSGVGAGIRSSGAPPPLTSHPLHKYYTYATIHLSELIARRHETLTQLLESFDANSRIGTGSSAASSPSASGTNKAPRVLVVDCMTGFQPLPQEHEIPISPIATRHRTWASIDTVSLSSLDVAETAEAAAEAQQRQPRAGTAADQKDRDSSTNSSVSSLNNNSKMHSETRRRQFGSDLEILVRALCAEKGWNALISRRRRGCIACAIREAGALGWKVIIRVD